MNRSPRDQHETPAKRGFHGDGGNRTHGPFPPSNPGCIIWKGACNSKGYGVRTVDSKRWLAHRYAYVQAHGALRAGMQLHHTCHNRLCINPDHLQPVSALEHRRAHMATLSAPQVIEETLRNRALVTRRLLIHAGAANGVSEIAITTALSRMPNVECVSRGLYRLVSQDKSTEGAA